jgi:hypothetical protein
MSSKTLPDTIAPRCLTKRQAAAYWGVSYNTFAKLIRLGIAPAPIDMPELGRLLFDREQLDVAMDSRSKPAGVA